MMITPMRFTAITRFVVNQAWDPSINQSYLTGLVNDEKPAVTVAPTTAEDGDLVTITSSGNGSRKFDSELHAKLNEENPGLCGFFATYTRPSIKAVRALLKQGDISWNFGMTEPTGKWIQEALDMALSLDIETENPLLLAKLHGWQGLVMSINGNGSGTWNRNHELEAQKHAIRSLQLFRNQANPKDFGMNAATFNTKFTALAAATYGNPVESYYDPMSDFTTHFGAQYLRKRGVQELLPNLVILHQINRNLASDSKNIESILEPVNLLDSTLVFNTAD